MPAMTKRGDAVLELSPKIYPLDVIYSAAYVFLDRAYVLLDEKDGKIVVQLSPKQKRDSRELAKEFTEQLINYSFYKKQLEKNAVVKELILKEIFTQFSSEDDYLKDPEGIMIPWEEKYGAKAKQKAVQKRGS